MARCKEIQMIIDELENPNAEYFVTEAIFRKLGDLAENLLKRGIIDKNVHDSLKKWKEIYNLIGGAQSRDEIKYISRKCFPAAAPAKVEDPLAVAAVKACIFQLWEKLYEIELVEGRLTCNCENLTNVKIELYQTLLTEID